MSRGNVAKVEADAEKIAKRLMKDATITGLMQKYHCAYETLMRAIRKHLTEEQITRAQKRNCAKGGHSSQYKKGQTPWNKELKGIHLSPATEFKPSRMSPAAAKMWCPIGTISIRHDKPSRQLRERKRKDGLPPWQGKPRKWIKVADDGKPSQRWIPLARYVWEQAHGPIPTGMLIVHVDGDQLNDDLSNLRLVNRQGHIALQRRRDPGHEERRCKAAGKAATLRHQTNRELRKLIGPVSTVWECQTCGGEAEQQTCPERCTKCGSSCYAKLQRRAAG